jgi:hypothetical protein
MRRSLATVWSGFATLLLGLPAQTPTDQLAAGLVRAQVPATDDPDALILDLVRTASAHRRSPAAYLLVQEAIGYVHQAQDLAAVRAALPPAGDATDLHGRLAQRLADLRWWLDRAIDGRAAAGLPPRVGYVQQVAVAGPYGDHGDHFVGVVLPPELEFPPLGSTPAGRGGTATVHLVTPLPYSDYLALRLPGTQRSGAMFAHHRVAAAMDVEAWLEVECPGSFQLFVDRREVLRVERWRATAPRHHYVPLHVPAGEHVVLLKTGQNEQDTVTLRWVDAQGHPVAALRELPIVDPTLGPTGAAARPREDRYLTASAVFQTAAAAADASDHVRLAALLAALRDGDDDLAIDLAEPLRQQPPQDPLVALAFATTLRAVALPDEVRKAEARRLIERAAPALDAAHHAARLARATLLDEQDQREAALRLLAAHPAPGTATFQRRHALLRQLRFTAEEPPLLHEWLRRCPLDPRPLGYLADLAAGGRDGRTAKRWREQAAALRHDMFAQTQGAFRLALDLGDFAAAQRWLDRLEPDHPGRPPLGRLRLQLDLAVAADRSDDARTAATALLAHPDADAELLLELANRAARLGCSDLVPPLLQRSLDRNADQPAVRSWLARLGQGHDDEATFASFRLDSTAAIAAFTAGEREQGASTTIVFDQRVVLFAADGSWTAETHQLRRVNDQAGVERFAAGSGLGNTAEAVVVRTIAADGSDWIPGKIDDDYTMQRLAPGAFLEWRWRERGEPPAAAALATAPFYFAATDEPCVATGLIVVRPAGARGEVRTRGLEAATTSTLPDGREVLQWRREQVPSIAKENFLPAVLELAPVAEIGEDRSPWADHREQRVELLSRTRPTAPIRARAAELFAGVEGDRAKAHAAWQFCQERIEAGPAERALETLLRGKGSRFLLAVALLRAAEVPVVPLLTVEAREELTQGRDSLFERAGTLSLGGAAVLCRDGERIVLFPDTPRHWPLGAIPAARAGGPALLLHDGHSEPCELPASADRAQTLRVRGTATVRGKDVQLEATAELGDVQGYGLADRLAELKDNVQKQAARQVAQQLFTGWRVEQARFTTVRGGPLRLEARLKRGGVQPNGDRFVAPLPLPPTRFVASFGDRAERTLPYRLPGDMLTDWQIDLALGDELRVTQLPAPVLLLHESLCYEQHCTLQADGVRIRRLTRLGGVTLPAHRFADWLRALATADRAEQATLELAPREKP